MQEIKHLLHDYIVGGLSSEEFVIRYLALARSLRDETLMALDNFPDIKEKLHRLSLENYKGTISELDYGEKWVYLTDQLGAVRIKPYSDEEKILSHLFVEADAYRENPEDREPGLHIGDTELRAEVQKALELLS
ncbi:MAG: hypothetical protein KC546_05545 [Anaerolineae bacterium]|nr:hypothetical protein [Anaerolineae bacterium]